MKEALVLEGYGINCNREMEVACQSAGAKVTSMHIKCLFDPGFDWSRFKLIVFPGGFTFGDEMGAGKALANRLSHHACSLRDHLFSFVAGGGMILGICNGFQLLVKLGLLPSLESHLNQSVSLAFNNSAHFECRWIDHEVLPSRCLFTQNLQALYLPIRHGEGKFVAQNDQVIKALFQNGQVVLRYQHENPNGSTEAIAGICDPTGRILGMMAHPEAAIFFTQDPHWIRKKEQLKLQQKELPIYAESLSLFKNALN
ncbi:MAG TPA: phosphoribosylformylglycinamidine synthase subunit PurQ [Rhabdochlamydiaceae bacterium]|nr:phosphoribosylformylglycinamidine synthase subunit PurQ [Rhabdochlamydiaceae bacterium]